VKDFSERGASLPTANLSWMPKAIGPSTFWWPERLVSSGWLGHAPFAFWITGALAPSRIVELGAHNGYSYFAFCQAVKKLGLPTKCVAIDTWEGDEHAGFYSDAVYQDVWRYNSERYSDFSRLMRMRFDQALESFEDGTVDLLHVDGRHRYEDVKEDFESWKPKLSDRAVVLFHDTNVRERDFGVYKYWEQIREEGRSFEFLHGHGLGVLGIGENIPDEVTALFDLAFDKPATDGVRLVYSRLGDGIERYYFDRESGTRDLEEARSIIAERERHIEIQRAEIEYRDSEFKSQIRMRDAYAQELNSEIFTYRSEVDSYQARIRDLTGEIVRLERRAQLLYQEADRLVYQLYKIYSRPLLSLKRKLQRFSLRLALLFGPILPASVEDRQSRSLVKRRPRKILQDWITFQAEINGDGYPSIDLTRHSEFCSSTETERSAQRILVVDYRLPRPDTSAGERMTVGLLKDLCALGYDVYFAPGDMRPTSPYLEDISKLGVQVVTSLDGYRGVGDYLLAEGHKFGVFYFARVDVAEPLVPLARHTSPDARVIFHAIDLYFLREERAARLSGDAQALEAAGRTRALEIALMESVDHVVLVSPAELPYVEAEGIPSDKISIFPGLYSPVAEDPASYEDREHIFFLAGFGHPPNRDAVIWFADEIWPTIREALPGVEFHVVGAEAPPEVVALSERPGINVIGFVPDLEPVLQRYRVSVAPLRYGAGIKGKVAASMGAGVPTVCTDIAAEGMGMADAIHTYVRNDPELFAQAVIDLYRDRLLWRQISENGRALVEARFGPAANRISFLSALQNAQALPQYLFINYCRSIESVSFPVYGGGVEIDVSIIVPVFNKWNLTQDCLKSIWLTALGSNIAYEVILADDGSSDETVNAATLFPGLKVSKTSENVGFIRNCNQAAEVARGRHILLLNNDTIVMPGWLQTLLETLDSEPGAGIVGSKLIYPDGVIQEAGGVLFADGTAANVGRGRSRFHALHTVAREVDYISGASILVRGSFWRSVGGFDTSYSTAYYEDADLAMAVRHHGYRVLLQPRSEVVHFEHSSYGDEVASRPKVLMAENGRRFAEKWAADLRASHLPAGMSIDIAAANAERHPLSAPSARRSKGTLNILYLSPFPMLQAAAGRPTDYLTFGGTLAGMGHKVHVAILDSPELNDSVLASMQATWETVDVISDDRPPRARDETVPFDGWYFEGLGEEIRILCAKYDIDVVVCSYVMHSKIFDHVPAYTLKIIDAYERMGNRARRLQDRGVPSGPFSCSPEEEGAYLRRADVVIAENRADADYFNAVSGIDSAVVVPHAPAARFERWKFDKLCRIGITVSASRTELEESAQFIESLNKRLRGRVSFVSIEIAGPADDVMSYLSEADRALLKEASVKLRGDVSDIVEFYRQVDLIVSPVMSRFGINRHAIYAMSYGMPLVTTALGSHGLGTDEPFHCHDSIEDLCETIVELIEQPDKLPSLAEASRSLYGRFSDQILTEWQALLDPVSR